MRLRYVVGALLDNSLHRCSLVASLRALLLLSIAAEMKAADKTVYRRIQAGKLKVFKEGGRWMIWRSALLAYLKAGEAYE